MMLSPPMMLNTSWSFWSQGVQDKGHMSSGSPSQIISAKVRQAWLEGNLIPCFLYGHQLSISFKNYPLLQGVTLAHHNPPSNFLPHWPAGCTMSTHLTVPAVPGTHFPFPPPCFCSCCSSHDAHSTTLHLHMFRQSLPLSFP